MALNSVKPVEGATPNHSALQNAYKAFDIASTLGNIYGAGHSIFDTAPTNVGTLVSDTPQLQNNPLSNYYAKFNSNYNPVNVGMIPGTKVG